MVSLIHACTSAVQQAPPAATAQGGETGRLQAELVSYTADQISVPEGHQRLQGFATEMTFDQWAFHQRIGNEWEGEDYDTDPDEHVHNWYEDQPPAGISFDSEMLGMFHAQRLHNEEAHLPESASPTGNVPLDVTAGVTLDAELLGMVMCAQRLHDEEDAVPPALVVESDSGSESDSEPDF